MSGIRSNGTDVGGPGYVHPRSDKYRDNFDNIFRKPSESGPKCEGDCEDCDCK
jgi:hypothetical protein